MSALYNEIDSYAARWLANLAAQGHIADGTVDSRSIADLRAEELAPFTQAHFFAGIGVWSHALRAAGWPDDVPVWTGSCPCQPFSVAGSGAGFDDARHLWPVWFRLISECRPPVIFGEQVEGADGRAWLDLVSSDLEGIGYAFGASILPAAGVGAPHIRHRTYFVAHAAEARQQQWAGLRGESGGAGGGRAELGGCGRAGILANTHDTRPQGWRERGLGAAEQSAGPGGLADVVGDAGSEGAGRDAGAGPCSETKIYREGQWPRRLGHGSVPPGATRGFWERADWILCQGSKYRPVEPGTFPLAHGAPGRVGRLRAYGNAINAKVATTFIRAAMGVLQ